MMTLLLLLLALAADTPPPPGGAATQPASGDHTREFDFWLGEWDVQNRRLQADGSWKNTTQARARIQSILDGGAVLEEWTGTDGHGLRGFSVRAYDPGRNRWVVMLNWTGGQPSRFGRMEGVFDDDGISILTPEALAQGRQRAERYTFSKATPDSCQWDAARTGDGGETWQTYWIMDFTRRGDAVTTDASNARIVQPPTRPYCDGAEHRQLDGFIGAWRGTIRGNVGANAREGTVVMRGTSMLEGCGIQLFTEITWSDGQVDRSFEAVAFDPRAGTWMRCAMGGDRRLRLHTRETTFDPATRTWTISTAAPRQQPTREVWSFPTPHTLRREEQAADIDWNYRPTGDTIDLVREE